MDAKLLALVCLSSVLLLFGCIGGGKSGTASKTSLPSAPSGVANASPAGGSLGDKDISPQVTPDDTSVLPDENLIPPDNLSAGFNGSAPSPGSAPPAQTSGSSANASSGADISQLTVSDTDIAIVEMNDSGIISDEDVVEPW